MATCPWYISAAAVRAWQQLEPRAPRDFDDASDALIELATAVWARYEADRAKVPRVTRTGAYLYEGGKHQVVDVLPRSSARPR